MATYFLSADGVYNVRIFATGLYVYRRVSVTELERFVIDNRGQLPPNPEATVEVTLKAANPAEITSVDDFIPVPGLPDTFLSLMRADTGSTVNVCTCQLE